MELNINSPAYFSKEYGIDNDVYRYCQKCYTYFKDKEYSSVLHIIGICPQIVPQKLYEQWECKERVKMISNCSCAIVEIRIDFDKYYNANSEERICLMKDAILRAVKKVKSKCKFDYNRFYEDLENMI